MKLIAGRKVIAAGVGLKTDPLSDIRDSLTELLELIGAAGGEVVGSVIQVLPQWVPATLIGSGKVDEIRQLVEDTGAQMVVVDHQLTGAQARNLSEETKATVIDRTQLIIEIFAIRAQTHEGKLQVELAQMTDQYSRMVGAWHGSLSRLGGGIGTRGPGEKAIELDRRTIRKKITAAQKELENTRKHRAQHRASRKRQQVPQFALIGYTNTGKSTILSRLSKSEIHAENLMFATLDPTTRKVFLPDSPPCVVTDTVGFIRKLPTQLISAFRATLEESEEADVLLHVVDFSHSQWSKQMEVVEDLMKELKWDNKPLIHVFNKMDKAPVERKFQVSVTSPRVFMSALTTEGIEDLKREMINILKTLTVEKELFFPKEQSHLIFELSRDTKILKQEEGSQGVICNALFTPGMLSKWQPYFT